MGDLLTTIRVDGVSRLIEPVSRRLESGGASVCIRAVCELSGGMILGEGDTGKSTYAKMLCEEARRFGPSVLVLLRKRSLAFDLPEVKTGETATIVFDGLDEFPECARDLVDLAEGLDPRKCHLWVTSRAVDAAAVVCESVRFEKIYRLSAFRKKDVCEIADAAGLSGADFLEAVSAQSLDGFIEKPGGAVLLLQLFARGQLDASSRADLMETIARACVAETRDGHVVKGRVGSFATSDLMNAASWIAACLCLSRSEALWTGAEHERPAHDLCLSDVPGLSRSHALIDELLLRRIFEPLTDSRLRISYSGMASYLAGRWLARNVPVKKLIAKIGRRDLLPIVEEIVWATIFDSDYGMPFVRSRPELFTACRNLIERVGFETYLNWMTENAKSFETSRTEFSYGIPRCGVPLAGFGEFAKYLVSWLKGDPQGARKTLTAAGLLVCCRYDESVTADVLVSVLERILARKVRIDPEVISMLLVVACGTSRPPALERLRPYYERTIRKASFLRESEFGLDLMKLFDYSNWIVNERPQRFDACDEDEIEDGVEDLEEDVLTEREVAALLRETVDRDQIGRLREMEHWRGLPYQSLASYFENFFQGSADQVFEDFDRLLCLLQIDFCRGIRRIMSFAKEYKYEVAAFIEWVDIRHLEFFRSSAHHIPPFASKKMIELLRDRRINYRYFHDDLIVYLKRNIDASFGKISEQGDDEFEKFEKSLQDDEFGDDDLKEDEVLLTPADLSKLAARPAKPVKAEVVAVTPAVERKLQAGVCENVVKGVAEAVRNKGGRPRKADHATDAMTQKEVAIMFGPSCTESKVNNWERFDRSGGKVGSMPPSAEYKGHPVSYSADLRKFPTPENKAILAAIIERYKSTAAVKDGIRHKADLHFKNAETAFRGRGGIQTELAKGRG